MIDKEIARILAPREAVQAATNAKEDASMMDIQPLTETFVADICGLDVGKISARSLINCTMRLKYGVLRLRNQRINEEQLQAFSAKFGPLEEAGRMSEADKAVKSLRHPAI